ncbi:nuclear transport factor 2 family protein [Oxalobacteraceae bacterium]|nr:nuclear transport factor 2 family protein [Oxalobacteraceae bacterium]
MKTAVEVVEAQFEAYNARDLERFMANFSDTIKTYRMPAPDPVVTGKAALAEFYATQRFNLPELKAELLSRTVMGNKVFDHERVWGVQPEPLEMVVVFEVLDGLIDTIWTFPR